MSVETWADRPGYQDTGRPDADLITCPCCGRRQAADMVLKMPAAPPGPARDAILAIPGLPWSEWPEYACTAELSRVHRAGRGAGVPGRR